MELLSRIVFVVFGGRFSDILIRPPSLLDDAPPALPAAGDKENDQPSGAPAAGKGGLLKKGAGGGALRLSWKGSRSSAERKASKASRKEAEALSEGGLDLRSEDEESFCGDQPSGLRQSWELPGSRARGLGLESHDLFLEGASPSKNSLVLTR